MRNAAALLLITLLSAMGASPPPDAGGGGNHEQFLRNLADLPLHFEPNHGQAPPDVLFLTRTQDTTILIGGQEATIHLRRTTDPSTKGVAVHMRLLGAQPPRAITPRGKLPGISNYLLGNDPKNWRTDIPQYERVELSAVYPGIDLIYYGNGRSLEYDFRVAPGEDPDAISLEFAGMDALRIGESGELLLETGPGNLVFQKPFAYQEEDGDRVPVEVSYELGAEGRVGFRIGEYALDRPLIIDPTLRYSALIGGESSEYGADIAVDDAGNAYVTGYTRSWGFPVVNPAQPYHMQDQYDVFVFKLDASGSTLLYSTFVGGSDKDYAEAIDIDAGGNAYVTGYTQSVDFPTRNPAQINSDYVEDAFAFKLSGTGSSLLYSTYLGGWREDFGRDLAVVRSSGDVFIVGYTDSSDFPLQNPYRSTFQDGEAFVVKLDSNGVRQFSTYLGGDYDDWAYGVAVDANGNPIVTGHTHSSDLPVSAGALQPGNTSSVDGFVTKLSADGASLLLSTYLGGTGNDYPQAVSVDSAGSPYVCGRTYSDDFPTTPGSVQPAAGGGQDAFVAKLLPDFSGLAYGTYLGGARSEECGDLAVDLLSGSVVVTGTTTSHDYPTHNPLQTAKQGPRGTVVASTDGGTTWAVADSGLSAYGVTGLSVDPADPDTVVAATGEGAYRSVDGGASWATTDLTGGLKSLTRCDSSTLYAADDLQIYKSEDGGSSWNLWAALQNENYVTELVCHPTDSSKVFVLDTVRDAVLLVAGNGFGWPEVLLRISRMSSLAVDPTNPDVIYAGSKYSGLYKTIDGGDHWTVDPDNRYEDIRSLAIDPSNPDVLYKSTYDRVHKSVDGGESWEALDFIDYGATDIAVAPSESSMVYAISRFNGLFRSTDSGASWASPGNDIETLGIERIEVAPSDAGVVYAGVPASYDAFVTKLNATGSGYLYSSYLGGAGGTVGNRGYDAGRGIAIDASGDVYVAGFASSSDFPVTPGSLRSGPSAVFVAKISEQTDPCTYAVAPKEAFFYEDGGRQNFSVVAPSGCDWSATASADWIEVRSDDTSAGLDTVRVYVAENSGGGRSGNVTIGGVAIPISQAASGCVYSVSPASAVLPASGGTFDFDVTTTPDCEWMGEPVFPWISLSPDSGVGSGAFTVTVAPYSGLTPHAAYVRIGQTQVKVEQTGTCSYALSSYSITVPAVGGGLYAGPYSVEVTPSLEICPWSITQNEYWFWNSGEDDRRGSGTVDVYVNDNDSSAPRIGTISIAGLDYTVTQAGRPDHVGAFQDGWWLLDANGNFTWDDTEIDRRVFFSLGAGEVPVTGDWNGSGTTKIGVYRDGTWLLDFNGNGVFDGAGVDKLLYFGAPGYEPFVGDWDGTGTSKIAVHHDGTWMIDYNGNFQWDGVATDKLLYFGGPGFQPYIGDWDGTGTSKIAVHQSGTWIVDYNGNFQWDGTVTDRLLYFGGPGYTPVTGDWNGDGATDLAAYQDGTWIVDYNGNFAWDGIATDKLVYFGGPGYTPMSGDWDGSGADKVAAYLDGQWVLDVNGNYAWDTPPTDQVIFFGGPGHTPVVGAW